MSEMQTPVQVLWTGGWDSTFLVLDLVLKRRQNVQPHYLIDPDRPSASKELATIHRIQNEIAKKNKHASTLLHPVIVARVEDVAPDPEITASYQRIIQTYHLGSQYEYFARYCKEKEINNLQIGILGVSGGGKKNFYASQDYKNKEHLSFSRIIKNKMYDNNLVIYKFDADICSADEYCIFKYFTVPLFGKTKKSLQQISIDYNFVDIMNLTWFCHRPLLGLWPCGRCNPCADAIHEGFGSRVGVIGRTVSVLKNLMRSIS